VHAPTVAPTTEHTMPARRFELPNARGEPRAFVSLEDAEYVANVIAAGAQSYRDPAARAA